MTKKLHMDDTIAAIATAPGEGGVSIVRISGPESLRIADDVFVGHGSRPSERPSHVVLHGNIMGSGGALDDVLLLIMRAPHSYTGEDVVEIQGHGGRVPVRRILGRVLEAGARAAEPGEFTQRAFLNGRMDLLQAEAVLDFVRSATDRAATAALEQLQGGLSGKLNEIYDILITAAANVEATLDFPEEDFPTHILNEAAETCSKTMGQLDDMLATWHEGHMLREGIICVITGKTNVGKSTLLNTLLERGRAIVSPRPGTTRDTIEEIMILSGFMVRLVDTAGLRETDCDIEQEGIRRTSEFIEKADIRIHMLDSSSAMDELDKRHLAELDARRSIIVLNKSDLGTFISEKDFCTCKAVETSLKEKTGVEKIRAALIDMITGEINVHAPAHAVISERHRCELEAAKQELLSAYDILQGEREDKAFISSQHIGIALERLGSITGRSYGDELLTSVFSKFCIGK